jgi:hypothetical protein
VLPVPEISGTLVNGPQGLQGMEIRFERGLAVGPLPSPASLEPCSRRYSLLHPRIRSAATVAILRALVSIHRPALFSATDRLVATAAVVDTGRTASGTVSVRIELSAVAMLNVSFLANLSSAVNAIRKQSICDRLAGRGILRNYGRNNNSPETGC